jgi:hypothetical protein
VKKLAAALLAIVIGIAALALWNGLAAMLLTVLANAHWSLPSALTISVGVIIFLGQWSVLIVVTYKSYQYLRARWLPTS